MTPQFCNHTDGIVGRPSARIASQTVKVTRTGTDT